MAMRNFVSKGIGFNPGSMKFFITKGLIVSAPEPGDADVIGIVVYIDQVSGVTVFIDQVRSQSVYIDQVKASSVHIDQVLSLDIKIDQVIPLDVEL